MANKEVAALLRLNGPARREAADRLEALQKDAVEYISDEVDADDILRMGGD